MLPKQPLFWLVVDRQQHPLDDSNFGLRESNEPKYFLNFVNFINGDFMIKYFIATILAFCATVGFAAEPTKKEPVKAEAKKEAPKAEAKKEEKKDATKK